MLNSRQKVLSNRNAGRLRTAHDYPALSERGSEGYCRATQRGRTSFIRWNSAEAQEQMQQ